MLVGGLVFDDSTNVAPPVPKNIGQRECWLERKKNCKYIIEYFGSIFVTKVHWIWKIVHREAVSKNLEVAFLEVHHILFIFLIRSVYS